METEALGTAAVLALILLPLVSLIKKPHWSHEAKYALGLGAAIIAALGGAVVDGNVNSVSEFIPLVGTSFVTGQSLYNLYFANTPANEKLENIGV